jgi:hypothetical protein
MNDDGDDGDALWNDQSNEGVAALEPVPTKKRMPRTGLSPATLAKHLAERERYYSEIIPILPGIRRPYLVRTENDTVVKSSRQALTEFALNTGGRTLFTGELPRAQDPCTVERMQSINEMNLVNWGHADATSCIVLPYETALEGDSGCLMYRTWGVCATIDRVDPIFYVPPLSLRSGVIGKIGLAESGRLVEFALLFDVGSRTYGYPKRRIFARDPAYRHSVVEFRIIAAFKSIEDYEPDLERTLKYDPDAVVDSTVMDEGDPSLRNNGGRGGRRVRVVREGTRFYGDALISLGDFLTIVKRYAITRSAFLLHDCKALMDDNAARQAILDHIDGNRKTITKEEEADTIWRTLSTAEDNADVLGVLFTDMTRKKSTDLTKELHSTMEMVTTRVINGSSLVRERSASRIPTKISSAEILKLINHYLPAIVTGATETVDAIIPLVVDAANETARKYHHV